MRDRVGTVLVVFGVAQLAIGALMAAAPGTFFEEVGPYSPRNDHYIRDVSSFYLALGAVAVVAWRRPSWRVPVLAFSLLHYALHSVNHLVDIGEAEPEIMGPVNLASLVLTGALLAWALRAAAEQEPAP